MNSTTQMKKLEEDNARLRAQVQALTKQTNAGVCVSPFVLLAKEFLGNSQKVDGIKGGIRALTEKTDLFEIQEACAVQLKLLQRKQSRGYWPNDGLADIRQERWSKRYDILVSGKNPGLRWQCPPQRVAMNEIPYYSSMMNVDEMLVMLGKDPNRTFVSGVNEDGSENPYVVFDPELTGTHLVLREADDCTGEHSSLPKNTLAPPVDTETIRSNAPRSGCANECNTCAGPQDCHRLSRFTCHHFCCESFTDYCIDCGATALEEDSSDDE